MSIIEILYIKPEFKEQSDNSLFKYKATQLFEGIDKIPELCIFE